MISLQSLHQLCSMYAIQRIEYLIAGFECPLNREVERFLKEKAILYEKYNLTRTYLILDVQEDNKTVELLAYFTLAIKEFAFDVNIPKRNRRKILNTGFQADRNVPALLIAQLGKNFHPNLRHKIRGKDLLYLAYQEIRKVYDKIGGRITYVEAIDDIHLQSFYEHHDFIRCNDTNGNAIKNTSGLLTYVKALPKCL